MSDTNNGGANISNDAGGSDMKEMKNSSADREAKLDSIERGNTDTVDYTTYKRAVDKEKRLKDQLKQMEDRLATFERKEQEAQEQKLAEQQEWQKIAKMKDQEVKQLSEQIFSFKQEQINVKRKEALLDELGGVRRPEYLNFAPLDMIEVVDGVPDPHSVKLVAEDFRSKYADLLNGSNSKPKVPNRAAAEPSDDDVPDYSKDPRARSDALNSIFKI